MKYLTARFRVQETCRPFGALPIRALLCKPGVVRIEMGGGSLDLEPDIYIKTGDERAEAMDGGTGLNLTADTEVLPVSYLGLERDRR
jgi:hypothetical protein